MDELFKILPDAIVYLSCGFTFIIGYYFLIDRRFDFFAETSFTVMLAIGFFLVNFIQTIPNPFPITNLNFRNILLAIICLFIGAIVALIRNALGAKVNHFALKMGRRKSSSESFWYDLLDEKDKPVWVRLKSNEKGYILQGILLSLAESNENPYLLLGYCTWYDLKSGSAIREFSNNKCTQCVVRADNFDEIMLIYDQNSEKPININIQ